MKVLSRLFAGSLLTFAFAAGLAAQDKAATGTTPPKILVIQREFLKPGKAGTVHEKMESTFVQAMSRAKWPTHYLAVQSQSGKPRALFLVNYDSFESWEKDTQAEAKNATLSAAIDRAAEADGALLDSSDQGVFVYDADLSLRPLGNLAGTRYLEIWAVHVKPGHDKEWRELNKFFHSVYDKAVPSAHWATYQGLYGMPNGTYLSLTARKSAAELDRGSDEWKAFAAAMGDDGLKKLDEMFAAAVESSETQIFSFAPGMSYPPEELIRADGDFWKPKPATVTAAKAEKKAAGQP